MSVVIRIDRDETVRAEWTGTPGRSSLFMSIAPSNCHAVNILTRDELLLAFVAHKANPFPIDGVTGSREQTIQAIRNGNIVEKAFPPSHVIHSTAIGEFRRALVLMCGDSCNGPLDGWIKWVANNKLEVAV